VRIEMKQIGVRRKLAALAELVRADVNCVAQPGSQISDQCQPQLRAISSFH